MWRASSSTTSASLAPVRFKARSRSRMAASQSGIFDSSNVADSRYKRAPGGAPIGENLPSRGQDAVEAAAALACLFDPIAMNPTAILQPVQKRVQRGNAKTNRAFGAGFDQFRDFVTVAGLRFDEGQNEEFSAAFFQVTANRLLRHRL